MDLKSFKLGTNIWIVVGTIVFLGFAYFMYLNYYIAGKENHIISTRFRVLDQIGDNLDKKLASYIRNAQDQVNQVPDSIKLNFFKSDEKAKYLNYIVTKPDINKSLNVVDIVYDSIAEKLNLNYPRTNISSQ